MFVSSELLNCRLLKWLLGILWSKSLRWQEGFVSKVPEQQGFDSKVTRTVRIWLKSSSNSKDLTQKRVRGRPIPSPWREKYPAIKGLRPPERRAGQFHPDHEDSSESTITNKQTNKQANKQASKQANTQASKQTNKQTSKQTNKQTTTINLTNPSWNRWTGDVKAWM